MMIGQSRAFRESLALIARIARCDAPALIEGETGTGKELAARAIHYQSARSDRPFIPVNCGAIPDQLIENELFGHAQGAFTDARRDQPGLVAHARGGTLFLDEVDALTAKGQVTLLRFLQDNQYRPLGGRSEQVADVRIVAASNQPLLKLAESGGFRMDLLFRLKILNLELPPLRVRKGDAALLAAHFVERCAARFGQPVKSIEPETLDWFADYAWPGNVRELENLICREFLLGEGDRVALPPPAGARSERRSTPDRRRPSLDDLDFQAAKALAIAEFEKRFLSEALARAGGNVTQAASLVGKERRTLGKLIKKHGLDRRQYLQ